MNTESVQLRKALYNGILWTAARHFEWGVDQEGGWGFVASPKGENVGVWGRSPQENLPGPLVARWSSYELYVWLLLLEKRPLSVCRCTFAMWN